ncbi:hypothetical protein [Fictibacillus sp. FJAT-27399]|uniref:hypothetical protein n=1 Tax=Fictibacillus sp. FJAT-27399 TaxID=1729689 RepID=UPI000781B68C|nr:hypothetical protein [Fictibacillus sp. FJAT-27399]
MPTTDSASKKLRFLKWSINSLKLLGVSTILSGIKPDVAQTAVQLLGIGLSSAKIYEQFERRPL